MGAWSYLPDIHPHTLPLPLTLVYFFTKCPWSYLPNIHPHTLPLPLPLVYFFTKCPYSFLGLQLLKFRSFKRKEKLAWQYRKNSLII